MMVTIAWNPLKFHLLDALPKGTYLMPSTARLIFSQNFFRSARRLMGGDSPFMLTAQDPTAPENPGRFAKKIGSASVYTHRTYLISHRPTSFSSDISNIVCRESLFHHVKNYLQQFMKWPGQPATNLGGHASALDVKTRVNFSEQWLLLP
jgi:hypothetical protein